MNTIFLKNRKIIALIGSIVLLITGFFVYKNSKVENIEKLIESNEIIFTAEEKQQIDKFSSVDEVIDRSVEGDAAAKWVIGQCHSSGQAGVFLDKDMALDSFGSSASLGFGPALYALFEIYTFEQNNPFLGMVYLNLTIASGHQELLHKYDLLYSKMAKEMGVHMTNELQKIIIHKRKLIERNAKIINKSPCFINEDILFGRDFWEKIYTKKLNTENITNWLNNPENVAKQFKQLSDKVEMYKNKKSAYE